MTINDHTGAKQQTKPASKEYEEGWERIFGKNTADVPGTDESPKLVVQGSTP